ncbi:MAG: DUF5684 domain-containing protein [Planctomycetaceae bacterium]|jgi:hypothetical protein
MVGDAMWILAQQGSPSGAEGLGIGILLLQLALAIGVVAGLWKVFEKAGKPGWAALIPIYNLFVYAEVAGKPVWWALLMLIPCVNLVVWILLSMGVAKNFGKSEGYGIGLGLLSFIFLPLLGFSDAKYRKVTQ